MWKKRILAALLVVALLAALPAGALAAKKKKVSIKFPTKVGLMLEGKSATLKPRLTGIKPADLAWSSSDESVLRLSGNVAQSLKAGTAVVTAAGGGKSARCGVVVLPASVTLAIGERVSLPRGGVEQYKMKDAKIASVSKGGAILGKRAGQTRLRVAYGSQKVMIEVVVTGVTPQTGSAAAKLDCAAQAEQIVLVDYTGGSSATLSVHEKKNDVWTQLFECPAYVGRNGIGKTRAGDKKTPTGTYNLTTPFGIKADPGAQMPYTKVTKYHYWCGASGSGYYNQLVDERTADRKHTSSDEYLINYKGVYNYCMFIDYNAAGVANKGSCIFLHCTGKNKYTGGCVAVSESYMKRIICWARPGVKIVVREKP